MEEKNVYPRFLDNAPCGEDLFEGKSQQKIAANICNVIKTNKSCNIIGIDGSWGAGKSNLVGLLDKTLSPDGYHFFIYDSWGHQEDLQRRSFLEELTEDLTEKEIVPKVWVSKLDKLLAKAKRTESKKVPKLSIGIIIAALAILITPLFKSISDKVDKVDKIPHHYAWSLFVLCIPLLFIIGLLISFIVQEKNATIAEKVKRAFTRLFLEYQNKLEEETRYEVISEDEPSVRKFRNWMWEISKDLGSKKLILVFDNMDRLPQKKVQELWSSIHVFFCEHSYDNIKVIVPFDREHIKLAFKSEDNDKKQYGDDFINKSFNVVYRVSPPILSDWKNYFAAKWKEAFGEDDSAGNSVNVLQIFDLLSEEITPRRIIAFINEFVSIKLTIRDTVPNNYIALFILGKTAIVKKPIDEIISPTYLKGLSYLYADDEELPKFIASLYYQVEPNKAIQIIFTERIKKALNENAVNELEKISSIPEFYDILETAIVDVANYENAILALNKLPSEKIGNRFQAEIIWNSLYKKTLHRPKSLISEYQLVLLSKISKQQEYLEKIINNLIADPSFSSINYMESIKSIDKAFKETLPVFSVIKPKQTSVADFIEFVSIAKADYTKYKIKTDQKGLNDYLASLEIARLKEVNYLPYLTREYSFAVFGKKIEELIIANSPNNDKEVMSILYSRYKEISTEKPLKVKIEDPTIYTLFTNSNEKEDFYYELIAMRLAKLEKFNASYSGAFDAVLQNTDKSLVRKIADRLENYITYEGILLGLKTFSGNVLFKEVAKELTTNSVGASRANVGNLIANFQVICELGQIEPAVLLKRLNNWENYLSTEVKKENIKATASPFFFEKAVKEELSISSHCIETANEYLNSLSEDEWKTSFTDLKSYEVKISLIIDYKFTTTSFEAIKNVLRDISLGSIAIPDKDVMQKLIEKLEKQGRNFKATFNSVRDLICRDNCMTVSLFKYFGDWLFQYADMEANQASLRTIFIPDVLRDNECMDIILNHVDKMPAIIGSAKEEASDFTEIIKDRLASDESEPFVVFAKSIGVQKEEPAESMKE